MQRPVVGRTVLALLAVGLAPSCGGTTQVQADEALDCRDATLAEVCPKAGCRTLDEEVDVAGTRAACVRASKMQIAPRLADCRAGRARGNPGKGDALAQKLLQPLAEWQSLSGSSRAVEDAGDAPAQPAAPAA